MKIKNIALSFIALMGLMLSPLFASTASADEMNEYTELWQISNGGKIYDN